MPHSCCGLQCVAGVCSGIQVAAGVVVCSGIQVAAGVLVSSRVQVAAGVVVGSRLQVATDVHYPIETAEGFSAHESEQK